MISAQAHHVKTAITRSSVHSMSLNCKKRQLCKLLLFTQKWTNNGNRCNDVNSTSSLTCCCMGQGYLFCSIHWSPAWQLHDICQCSWWS